MTRGRDDGEPSGEREQARDSEIALALEAWAAGSELSLLVDAAEAAVTEDSTGPLAADSLVVHLRSLGEYLVGRVNRKGDRIPGRPTDLHAWRYLPAWNPHPTDAVELVDNLIGVADKHLAHLTLERTSQVAHWTVIDVVEPLLAVAEVFADEASDAGAPIARFLRPYVAFSTSRWERLRAQAANVRIPTTTFTSRLFITPEGEGVGAEGKWAARLGPFVSAGLAPLWPDWPPDELPVD